MQILNLEQGLFFEMGDGKNWRVVHPDMGATQITLNHGIHAPGQEFTQHIHDESEDAIVCVEGSGSIRQGDIYTPITAGEMMFIPAGEVHGTKNTTDQSARMMSFQAPPDMALYRGERNHALGQSPTPTNGHVSSVQVIDMGKAGPVFGKPCDWRNVVSDQKGAQHLSLDFIQLQVGEAFEHQAQPTESVYVFINGSAQVIAGEVTPSNEKRWNLTFKDVIFLSAGDTFSLCVTTPNADNQSTKLVYCRSLARTC